MSREKPKSVLTGLSVREAMRHLVVRLYRGVTLAQAIREMIKFKVNAVLVVGEENRAVGVVSKTNILGAYYAELPINSPLDAIMVSPVHFVEIDDSLDTALDRMREHGIHRVYVRQDSPDRPVGVVAYPDILGLLYRYCHKCPKSTIRPRPEEPEGSQAEHFRVSELMTTSVCSHIDSDSLIQVMERLFTERLRAVLVKEKGGTPVGVVTTTDLMIAFLHGLSHDMEVRNIMSSPVRSCNYDEPLVMAIQKMIFADVQNLYVYRDHPRNIVGTLSLSYIARVRSGSCRACVISRIEINRSM